MFDNLFYLTVMAFGFGLSLATYRMFALRNGWPMGAFHADLPGIPIMIGLTAVVVSILYASNEFGRGGWLMLGSGFVLALVWTSLLRVGSQLSLFLAPVATGLLLVGWLGSMFGYDRAAAIVENPREIFKRPAIEQPR